MKISHNKTRGFTMIEIMVAVGIIVVLATILVALVSGVNDKGKATSTQAKMNILGEAVEAFKQSTGKYPLAVPEDAWVNWSTATTGFAAAMKWRDGRQKWTDYFASTTGSPNSGLPDFTWNPTTNYPSYPVRPTNIHMLTFQLQQVPESNSILERLKQSSGQVEQKRFAVTPSGLEEWERVSEDCRLVHPLNPTAIGNNRPIAFQPVDAWGTPLRFWTGDILPWAKQTLPLTGIAWDASIQQLLSDRLQKANWGFFIESAGKDGRFGWWGHKDSGFIAQETEDNLYKP